MRISDWSSDVCSSDLGDRQHGFRARALDQRKRFRIDVGHDLGDAMMIAQVHEQQVAMVALAVNPARQADLPPHVGGAQFGAMVRAIRMHSASRFQQLFVWRSEEHTSELQSLMRISYAVFCLKKKKKRK